MAAESGKGTDPQRRGSPGVRRGHRRVTAPGTSGRPEQAEPEISFSAEEQNTDDAAEDARDQWLKSQRPPHWD